MEMEKKLKLFIVFFATACIVLLSYVCCLILYCVVHDLCCAAYCVPRIRAISFNYPVYLLL